MAEMEMREIARGEFIWMWSATNDRRGSTDDLQPKWPEHCMAEQNALHCGDKGLTGTLQIDGVGNSYSAALVRITWLDGQARVYTLTARQSHVQLFGSADDKRPWGEIAYSYTLLGIEHILERHRSPRCSCSACCSWWASSASSCGRSRRLRVAHSSSAGECLPWARR